MGSKTALAVLEGHRQARSGVVESIAGFASAQPGAPAIQARGVALSYGELEKRAIRLAQHLHSRGVGPEVVVAVLFPRSIALVVAELAILKAGGAYLPLDPGYPPDRLAFLLNDSKAPLILAPACTADTLPEGDWQVIGLDPEGRSALPDSPDLALPESKPEQLAYVIYTSGSTGQPKGVEVTNANLEHLVRWHQRQFQVTRADRATVLASPAFDASVWEIWPYLAAGASLYVADDCVRLVAGSLRDWLVKERISICFLPTALAEPMLDLRWPQETSLRYLLTGADTLRRRPSKKLPFRFINNYGPTECTVVTTSGEVTPQSQGSGLPAIGRAIDDVQVHIVDENLKPVASGETGQIYIGGVGVGRGYRNRPDLTAERFIPDPFSRVAGGRLYKTGDLARFTASGEIDFLGRADEQIKIRGHRIEPNEIVNALNENPLVAASAVVASDSDQGEKRLVAYVVSASNVTFSPRGLQESLRSRLPDYMIPTVFVRIDELPLTRNGKIDRAALPEPTDENMVRDQQYVPPSSPVQEKLAQIAGELLKVERISMRDNFFLLGGHSLLGTQLVTRVNQLFGIDLGLREIFEAPTIEELALRVEEQVMQRIASMSEEDVRRLLDAA
jgi:amino acid adenylation domain-containing protein